MRMKVWVGVILYTFILSYTLLYTLKHFYTILNTPIWSQAKPKLSFPQYLILTSFFNQKENYGNKDLSLSTIPLSNLVHFYTILETFMRFLLLYDPEHSYTISS